MKKITALLTAILLLAVLNACGSAEDGGGRSVVASCFPAYDVASHLLGDDGEVTLLLKPGQDNHSYEPSAKDVVRIKNSDLLLCIGGEDESWVRKLLSGKELKNVNTVRLIESVPPIALEDGHGEDDGHDHSHAYDEHIFTSPKNMMTVLDVTEGELIRLYPELKDSISERARAYRLELESLDAALTKTVSEGKRNVLIFGDRFPFLHLVTDYGIDYEAAYPGCSDMTEPSAATVAALIDKIKSEDIPVVFRTQLSNGKVADAIAEQTGAKVSVLHSTANVTREEWESGQTYYSLMAKNIETLKEALGAIKATGEN